MTDEKKSEEYAEGKAHEHYHFLFEENNGNPVDFAKLCYLDGLADGRKEQENKDKVFCESFCMSGRIIEFEKENAELKAQIKLLTEKVGFWEEQTKLKEAQIEEYDRLNMFDIARTDELKAQIEKMKCCANCKYENKSSYKHECLHTSKRCAGYENWEMAK